MQANEIHNSTIYQVLPDAPPAEKYRVGVAYLRDGVPSRARELIEEARARGHDGADVQFHWILALLSKRSYRDLTTDERERLATVSHTCAHLPNNKWSRSLKAVCHLLDCLSDTNSDASRALTELAKLPPEQREKIVRHLDLVLTGGMRDSFWAETRQNAENARLDHERNDRVWAYFQPDPIPPRTRRPEPSTTTPRDRIQAAICTLAAFIAACYLLKTIIHAAQPLPILAYLLAVAAAYNAARNGLRWRYCIQRLADKDRRYRSRRNATPNSGSGFARSVDHKFDYYFNKYAPSAANRQTWLAQTGGFRTALRNEIVELYRERKVDVGRVNWLIRYTARHVVKKWRDDRLFEYRERYRVSPATKTHCSLSTLIFLALAAYVVSAAIEIDLLPNTTAALITLGGALGATPRWSHILNERRRIVEDQIEHDEVQAARKQEFERWTRKLESTRPSETEMENWLTADKTLVLDDALKHYRLAWRDILTHTFLQTPGKNCKRARVIGGPPRYSKYDIRLFLITHDGVREVSTEIDFERAKLNGQNRNNFRFDAVSSVHVARTNELSYTLELTLMNGEPRNIRVTDSAADRAAPNETPYSLAKMSLEAAGFTHTLHILEGIAAEGKRWIERDPYINDNPFASIGTDAERPHTSE